MNDPTGRPQETFAHHRRDRDDLIRLLALAHRRLDEQGVPRHYRQHPWRNP